MSASPSGPSNSGTPTANGRPPQFIRRRKPTDPLRQHNRPPQRPPPIKRVPKAPSNGLKAPSKPNSGLNNGHALHTSAVSAAGPNGVNPPKQQAGFSQIPQGPYTEFPLFTTKRALREGLRYHVARFATKKNIDPYDQDQFTRPVSLHRRYPQQTSPGKANKEEEIIDDKDKEKLEAIKREKEAQREADLAQIAPTGNNASAQSAKKNQPREKTTQVWRVDENEEMMDASQLRFEETLPWHLEDAENKHTWVGNYEAALSETNVIFVIDGNSFKMVPLDKWYKFTAKNKFKTMTIEEAEAQMSQKSKASRWVMHTQQQKQYDQEQQATRRQLGNLYKVKGESNTFKRSGKIETQDADDLDFEGDLFEDDDEQPTVEPDRDEEAKYAAEKIKREQLGANLFGEGDENEVEKELEEEEKEAEAKKKLGKSMKKALQKREKNFLYDSDSSHPYSTSSDDDTSDEEKKKEDERKKEEETKLKAKSASKIPSGASSKGTNTPSGRPKHSEPHKRPNLKRPGSPNLSASETSGNESSRKKHKKKHMDSTSQPAGAGNPTSGTSRPISPPAPSATQPTPSTNSRKSSIIKLNLNPSKLSEIQSCTPNPSSVAGDGEGAAGEMSDTAGEPKRKSIKLRLGSGASNSRSASRAGSPASGSRAGSPAAVPQQVSNNGSQQSTLGTIPGISKPVTAEEIIAALPPNGITIGAMLQRFQGRIKDKKVKDSFIKLVKDNSRYNAEDKLLRPKV